jgi:chromosome segregation protein
VREAEEAVARAERVGGSVEGAAATLAREHAQRAELEAARAKARDAVSASEVEVETARKELLRAKSRHQSLEEIQRRYRGCASGVQVVMEHREQLTRTHADGSVSGESAEPVHGIMADFVNAPERFEPAVSAMLGDRLQGVVVDDPSVGASGVELLKGLQEGRTAFLPRRVGAGSPVASSSAPVAASLPVGWADPSAPSAGMEVVDKASSVAGVESSVAALLERPGVVGRLIDLVSFDGVMEPLARELLGDALVVDTLVRALEIFDDGARASGATIVTLEGDRLEPSGVVVGGAPDAVDSALLQQKREIRELAEIVAQLEDEFARARSAQQAAAQALRALEDAREQNEAAVLEAEKAHHAITREAELSAAERDRVVAERERVAAEHARLEARIAAANAEIEAATAEISATEARKPELRAGIETHEAELDRFEAEREQTSAALTEARVAVARWQQERKGLDETHDRIHRQLAQERNRLARLSEEAGAAEARGEALAAEIERLGTEHTDALAAHESATTAKHDAREAHDAVKVGVDDLDASIRETRRALEEERDGLSEVELGLRELELERDHLVRDVRDRYDDELHCVLTEFHHRPMVTDAQIKRASELKRLISRMGEVNLTAITEYEEVSERYEYLSGQRADLSDAIDQLQEAIDRINTTTKVRFRETFHQVNEKFQAIFPRLFNGGRAQLVMTDPSNLLETGVEIFAQPPGKKVASLDLLSGGEKALTAVSLIFGIFLIKPSPFCLLDEVDAPLDEANVGRFCDLIRELSDGTQFIIITHNKRTMETVDRIYGVTMQVKGISKLVSVDMRRTVTDATIH